ncbi:RNA polymerase sigma factor [Hyphococcus sp.]|uniref:RNA polymerase sigma factor n=1 Tax=Hyphococcus sp. TaxID=2038636 RepID=UPI003D0EEBBB
MAEIADGDHAAFTELMARYKAPIFRFILRCVSVRSEAEDLLQDVFVSVFSKAKSYDPAWKPSTWIYRIALNKCRDYGRKKRLRKMVSFCHSEDEEAGGFAYEPIDLGPNVEDIVARRQEMERLSAAIEALPLKMRSALVLHTIEGRSQIECSEILGVSRKSVEMLVYRARKILREKLGCED